MKATVAAIALVLSTFGAPLQIASAEPTKEECVRANEDGQTLRQQSRLQAARAEFTACLDPSCPAPVRQDCAERVAEIDRSSTPLTVQVDRGKTQRLTGLGLASLGLAGVVIGGVLGLVAKSTYDDAVQEDCAGDTRHCNAAGVTQVSSAHGQATVSTVAMISGGVLAAGGIALWATARRDVQVVPVEGGATLALGGRF